MGYQESLMKTDNEKFNDLLAYIKENKETLEDPPVEYCSIPSVITMKKNLKSIYMYSDSNQEEEIESDEKNATFLQGESYFWATGQRPSVRWLEHFINANSEFEVSQLDIEYLPQKALEGFTNYFKTIKSNQRRGTFENEYVIIEPIRYDEIDQRIKVVS